jgi:succinate-acetate transporter protein
LATPLGITSRVTMFAGTALCAWGAAWLSFRYYESRFLRMKGRFSS